MPVSLMQTVNNIDLQKLEALVKEGSLECEIGWFGGRRFRAIKAEEGETLVGTICLKDIEKRFLALLKKSTSFTEEVRERIGEIYDRIESLDDLADAELNEQSCIYRILTKICQLFGNCCFNHETTRKACRGLITAQDDKRKKDLSKVTGEAKVELAAAVATITTKEVAVVVEQHAYDVEGRGDVAFTGFVSEKITPDVKEGRKRVEIVLQKLRFTPANEVMLLAAIRVFKKHPYITFIVEVDDPRARIPPVAEIAKAIGSQREMVKFKPIKATLTEEEAKLKGKELDELLRGRNDELISLSEISQAALVEQQRELPPHSPEVALKAEEA